MAVLNKYALGTEAVIVPITLGATDSAVVNLAKKTSLIINNGTVGSLSVNVDGDTATSVACTGVGVTDLTGGKTFVVAAGTIRNIPLNPNYQKWLGDGNITITGGDAATAYILEV